MNILYVHGLGGTKNGSTSRNLKELCLKNNIDVVISSSLGAFYTLNATLEIKNIKIECSRSEEFANLHREEFDLAGARALASSGVTAELLSPLVKTGGKILTFKGEKVYEEISEVNNKWRILGLKKPTLNFYGGENSSKCILIWEKISPCSKNLPRRPGLAAAKKFWE